MASLALIFGCWLGHCALEKNIGMFSEANSKPLKQAAQCSQFVGADWARAGGRQGGFGAQWHPRFHLLGLLPQCGAAATPAATQFGVCLQLRCGTCLVVWTCLE